VLVGAGNMGELAAQHLVGSGVAGITVVNALSPLRKASPRIQRRRDAVRRVGKGDLKIGIVIATTGAPSPSYRSKW